MPQLPEGLRLDLTDALAGDVELAPDLFEGAGAAVLQPESELQDATFASGEPFEDALDLLLKQLVRSGVGRRQGLVVRNEVPEV